VDHRGLAELAAVVGALGAVLVLVPRGRYAPVAGLVVLAVAEALLAYALVPASDLHRLVHPPVRVGALVVGAAVLVALGFALARFPAWVPVALLAAAPFRVPIDLGHQNAFLLLPLYGVLAAAGVAFVLGALRGEAVPDVPRTLGLAAAAFVAFDSVSLLWSSDPRAGTIEIAFFILPFTALLAVAARAPWTPWLPRALAVTLVGLASLFALIGLWQLHSHDLPFAPDLEVANSYSSFVRVTSLFKDPSLYGRHLVLAIVVLVAALWLRRVRLALALPFIALLFAGLYFSYSQSSELTLFVVVLAITLVAADRPTRIAVAAACAAFVVVGGALVAVSAHGHSARSFTSGRTRLVSVTATVVGNHPVAGVGVGAQPLASRNEAKGRRHGRRKYASHATPLTVAAELGLVGIVLYIAFLVAVAGLIAAVWAADAALGLSLGAVFLALVLHSLFYSGFFEDPIMWGVPAVAAAFVAAVRTKTATVAKAVPRGSPSGEPAPATAPSRRS
jgi:putative inorganic carbon (hco3(-)) transporter